MHAFIQETEFKFSLSMSIYTIIQWFFLLKKALNRSCMLGVPEELVQAYITVLLQYKKGLTLGSKGIRYRKNKKTQGKQALDPFSQLRPSKSIPTQYHL